MNTKKLNNNKKYIHNWRLVKLFSIFLVFIFCFSQGNLFARAGNTGLLFFSDNFESDTIGALSGQNGWIGSAESDWRVQSDGLGGQNIIQLATTTLFNGSSINQAITPSQNSRIKADFIAVAGTAGPNAWLRRTVTAATAKGYNLFQYGDVLNLDFVNANRIIAVIASVSNPLTTGNWYTIEFEAINDTDGNPVLKGWVYPQGTARPETPTISATDTNKYAPAAGYPALATLNGTVTIDNVEIYTETLLGSVNPENVSISQNTGAVTISWDDLSISEPSIVGYKIKYGTSSASYATTTDIGNATSTIITDLNDGQTYYFAVSAYDSSVTPEETGNSPEVSITRDISAPSITSISAIVPASDRSTITWSTNEGTASAIEYGLTSRYSTSTSNSSSTTSHEMVLSDLIACTDYHYRILATDSANNSATSSDKNFRTVGCTGNANVITSTSSEISVASEASLSLTASARESLTLAVPASFTATSSSATFQAKLLNKSEFFAAVTPPTNLNSVGDSIYNLQALIDTNAVLSTFDQPLTISLTYDPDTLGSVDESTLLIYRYDDGAWTELSNCATDTDTNTVSCATSHFSDFGIFGETAASSPAPVNSTIAAATNGGGMPMEWQDSPEPPIEGFKIIINNGDTTTSGQTVTLSLSGGRDAVKMAISNSADFKFSSQENYSSLKTWNLCESNKSDCPPGEYKVYVKFYTSWGNSSEPVSSSIIYKPLEESPSIKIESPTPTTKGQVAPAMKFLKNLWYGQTANDIKFLQKFLNTNGYIVSKLGAGSIGQETTYFGPLTQAALAKFQTANQISPAVGFFGPITRAVVNNIK